MKDLPVKLKSCKAESGKVNTTAAAKATLESSALGHLKMGSAGLIFIFTTVKRGTTTSIRWKTLNTKFTCCVAKFT